MTMFSMKPKFDLSEFLAQWAPKKKTEPKKSQKKKTSPAGSSQSSRRVSRQETDTQD